MLRLAEGVILNLIITYPFLPFILLQVTPTANRNSYRVARLVGAVTQGSVLRPQPWAMKSQLLQSCQGCAPSIYKPHPSLPKGGRSTSTLISTLHMRKTKRIRHIVYNRFVPSPLREGTEKVPFFYDQNGKCLRFVTSLSANRLK